MITNDVLKNNISLYFLSLFFYNAGRTVPHAILTILLLDSGISLVQITIIQIVYMIVVTLFEIPSGYIADNWSRKKMYFISIIFLFISYLIVYIYHELFYMLIFSWSLYALSTVSFTGTVDNEIVNQLKEKKVNIKNFLIKQSYIIYISASISAILGSLLYVSFQERIYILSFILLFFSFISIIFFKENNKTNHKLRDYKVTFKDEIRFLLNDNNLVNYIVLYIALAFFYQPFYQYWQVVFENKNFDISYFGFFYVVFNIISIIANWIYSKINFEFKHIPVLIILIGFLSLVTFTVSNKFLFLLLFLLMVMLTSLYSLDLQVRVRKYSNPENISLISALMGTGNTLGSFLVLFLLVWTLDYFTIEINYLVYFLIFVSITLFSLLFKNKK